VCVGLALIGAGDFRRPERKGDHSGTRNGRPLPRRRASSYVLYLDTYIHRHRVGCEEFYGASGEEEKTAQKDRKRKVAIDASHGLQLHECAKHTCMYIRAKR